MIIRPAWNVFDIPSVTPLKKTNSPSSSSYESALGFMSTSPSPYWDCLARAFVGLVHAVPVPEFIPASAWVVSGNHGFPGVMHHLWFLQSSRFLFCLDARRGCNKDNHLELRLPLSAHCSDVGLCVNYHLMQEATSLRRLEQCPDL